VALYVELQRRARHAAHLIRAGFGSLWKVAGVLTLLVGGDIALVGIWGIKHLVWGVTILLGTIVLLITDGSYRDSRAPTHASGPSDRLVGLRELLVEGQAMKARLPARDKRGLIVLPSDLLNDYAGWKKKAETQLSQWPTFQAQFRGEIVIGLSFFSTERICSEIEQRTSVFSQIVHSLAEQHLA
jgi:hypothetical protein